MIDAALQDGATELPAAKRKQNSKCPPSSSQRREDVSIPETYQNWPSSRPSHRCIELQRATALEKSSPEPGKEPGAGRDPPGPPQQAEQKLNEKPRWK